jgi:hypothetical protein
MTTNQSMSETAREAHLMLPNNAIGLPLAGGGYVAIDGADYTLVGHRKWQILRKPSGTCYARATVNGKTIRMHTILMATLDGMFVDHIDGDGLNNRRSNLRFAISVVFALSRKAPITAAMQFSRYKGVMKNPDYWVRGKGKRPYKTVITFEGKSIFLGSFECEIEAAKAYDAAAIKYHGAFASPNLPEVL